ncbi:hypothetical protein RPALISO_169 [Ruegeria phage RpAliso]|nr:hypothetical protein RPALISO_169 [Ruegeria phage RpAliso]
MKLILSALAFIAVLSFPFVKAYATTDTVTVEVTDKYQKRNGDSDRYMVATRSNGAVEVFENTDTFLRWKFDSANVQAEIMPGDTCTFKVNGWRIAPILSWNRNILEATCSA